MNYLEIAKNEEEEAVLYGQQVLTKEEFKKQLNKYGYKISSDMSFYYTNRANKTHYKAFSCAVVHKHNNLRSCNIYNNDSQINKQKVNQFVKSVFVREKNIIWEIG